MRKYNTKEHWEDMLGKQYGSLTVLSIHYKQNPYIKDRITNSCYLLCSCVCGIQPELLASSVCSGKAKSCGCKKSSGERRCGKLNVRFKGYEEIKSTFWETIKRGAVSRGIEITLTIEQAWELYIKQDKLCALTGVPIVFMPGAGNKRNLTTASLDRIDPNKGYTIDNVHWIHKKINIMKNSFDNAEFIDWCHRVANHTSHHIKDDDIISSKWNNRSLQRGCLE